MVNKHLCCLSKCVQAIPTQKEMQLSELFQLTIRSSCRLGVGGGGNIVTETRKMQNVAPPLDTVPSLEVLKSALSAGKKIWVISNHLLLH